MRNHGKLLAILLHSMCILINARIQDINKNDVCPHLDKPGGPGHTLIAVKINGDEQMCCGCDAGYRYVGPCSVTNRTDTVCIACEEGSYIEDKAHGRTQCIIDTTTCRPDQLKIKGSTSRKHRCDCREGFHITSNGMCEAHTLCELHYGVKTPGSPFYDTKCEKCRHGYDSLNLSPTEQCTLTAPSNNHVAISSSPSPVITSKAVIPPTITSNSNIKDVKIVGGTVEHYMIGGSAFFVLVVLLSVVCIIKVVLPGQKRQLRNSPPVRYSSGLRASSINSSESSNRLDTVEFVDEAMPQENSGVSNSSAALLDEEPASAEHDKLTDDVSTQDNTMRNVRYRLSEHCDKNDIRRLLRYFLEGDPELVIKNLQKYDESADYFIEGFRKLEALSKHRFNLVLLRDFFHDKNCGAYAEIVEEYI